MKGLSWMTLLPLMMPLAVAASSHGYLGVSAGLAMTDVDSAELNKRMAAEGISGEGRVEQNKRLGWRLFTGYRWGPYFSAEAGYTDLGQIEATFAGTGVLDASNLEGIRAASGSGYEMALRGHYPINEQLNAYLRGGVFAWRSEYQMGNGGSVNFTGNDPFWGVGAELKLSEDWSARLSWTRYGVDHDDTDLLSLGISYRLPKWPKRSRDRAPESDEAVFTSMEPVPPAMPEPPASPEPDTLVRDSLSHEPPTVLPEHVDETPHLSVIEQEEIPAAEPEARSWVIQFGFDSTEPLASQEFVEAVGLYLATHPGSHAMVMGHSDSLGPDVYNHHLSRLRAEAVVEQLVAGNVGLGRIQVVAMGSSEPVADNSTPEGRRLNRRVVITVVPSADPRPMYQ